MYSISRSSIKHDFKFPWLLGCSFEPTQSTRRTDNLSGQPPTVSNYRPLVRQAGLLGGSWSRLFAKLPPILLMHSWRIAKQIGVVPFGLYTSGYSAFVFRGYTALYVQRLDRFLHHLYA